MSGLQVITVYIACWRRAVWWVPEMVLHMAVTLFSITWAAVIFFITCQQWKKGTDSDMRYGLAFAAAATCFGCIFFVLHFVASLLLDIVDTVYICYAMDKDTHVVTRPEVHAIYQEVPTLVGPVIENPDGGLAYGAPVAAREQQPLYSAPAGYAAAQAYPPSYSAQPGWGPAAGAPPTYQQGGAYPVMGAMPVGAPAPQAPPAGYSAPGWGPDKV